MRTKTVKPNGVVIDHPFPGYEVENPICTPLIRRTYSLAGQTIATRVAGNPVSGNNGRTYFYSDHLGSSSALQKPNGTVAYTWYLPFGGYRPGSAPTQTITDRDFTGQRENMELGLLYYNARYYVPYINRFVSADSIVPDPANPQSFNRYSYGYNNPVKYQDPTGHAPTRGCEYEGCDLDDNLNPDETWITSQGQVSLIDPVLAAQYPGDFTAEEAVFGIVGLTGIAAFPVVAEYAVANVIWPAMAKIGSTITGWLCLDGNCLNEAEVVYDHTLPAGQGETIIVQNIARIRLSPFGSALDRLRTLYHEQAHVILTPRGPLQGLRTNISLWGYHNSHLLKYAEEAIAESTAQLRTGGSLWTGLSFPFTSGYVQPARVALEGLFVSAGTAWAGSELGQTLENWFSLDVEQDQTGD